MAATGGTTSYSPLSLLTGTALLPKMTTVAKPATTAARPASTSALVSLSNPVLKPVSTMSGSSGSAASSASRPSTTSVKPPAYAGLDQALAQRYVAPAQQAQKIADAWETGTFLPTQTNTITGETRPAVPGMLQTVFDNLMLPVRAAQAVPGALQSAYSAFKLPGDVLAGRNQNFTPGYATPGGISDALNFAGTFGAFGSVVPRPANSLGMFGGIKAKTADLNALAMANRMTEQGVPRSDIWKATGWYKAPDGQWKFEIDDSRAVFRDYAMNRSEIQPPKPLMDILDHAELYRAYPELRRYGVRLETDPELGGSQYGTTMSINMMNGPAKAKSSMVHEGQHFLEDIENFGRGASPKTIFTHEDPNVLKEANDLLAIRLAPKPLQSYVKQIQRHYAPEDLTPDVIQNDYAQYLERVRNDNKPGSLEYERIKRQVADEIYHRMAGENEAKNVQARLNMTAAERRATAPWETQIYPDARQIVTRPTPIQDIGPDTPLRIKIGPSSTNEESSLTSLMRLLGR